MKQFVSKIWNSPSARNVGKLLSANIIAQAIGLLVYPVLTRMYTPEDFGLLNLFLSIGGVLIILAGMEWYNAIVLPKRDSEACAVVYLSCCSVLVFTLFLVITIPFAKPIAKIFDVPEFATYYWLMPFFVCFVGLWNILNYWYIRTKQYKRISGYQISQSFFSAGYKICFAKLPFPGGLMYATLLSPLCSLLISLKLVGAKTLRSIYAIESVKCREVAVKYANFPKYSMPRSLLNSIVGQLPVLVLTPLFGPRFVGFWGMALMLSFAPISMLSRALYQVLYQKTSEWVNNKQSIAQFYRKYTLYILMTVLPFFVVLWFFLPQLTAWLLGEEWVTVGKYIRWMLPWLTCSILAASTGYLIDVFTKQKAGLFYEIMLAVSRSIGVGLGVVMRNFEIAIAGYAIGSALVNGIQYIWLLSLVRGYEKTLT